MKRCILWICFTFIFNPTIIFSQEYKVLKTEAAPVIDGIPNDGVWKEANVLGDFYQNVPFHNEPPSERTEVKILYDSENLYILFSCYDSEPQKIIVQETARDQDFQLKNTPPWDNINFFIDTNLDHWTAYMFSLTVLNTQSDATIVGEGSNNDYAWDAHWKSETYKNSQGWFAEISIPFSEINFSCDEESHLRMNFDRGIPRKHEVLYWVNSPRNSWYRSNLSGVVTGISNIPRKTDISFQTSVIGFKERVNLSGSKQFNQQTDIDMQVYYNPFKEINCTISLNPDFSQIEVDEYLLNVTRYSIYVKERRPLFVKNSEIFETPISLFYSRRIGEKGDVIGGTKLFGTSGKLSYGFINAVTGDWNYFGLEPKNSSLNNNVYNILRAKYNLMNNLNLGMLLASQHESSNNFNRVQSLDLTYRNKKNYYFISQIANSSKHDKEDENIAALVRAGKEGSLWNFGLSYEKFDENFNVDNIGFYTYIPNIGYNRYSTSWNYNPYLNSKLIYNFKFSQSIAIQKDTDKSEHSFGFLNEWQVQFSNYWLISFLYSYTKQSELDYKNDENFYKLNKYGIYSSTDKNKRISAEASFDFGDYYNFKMFKGGKILQSRLGAELRPLINFRALIEFENIRILNDSYDNKFENLSKIIARIEAILIKNTFLRFLLQKQITKTQYNDPYIVDVDQNLNNMNSVLGYKFNLRTTAYLTVNYYWYQHTKDDYRTLGVKVSHIW